MARVLTDLDPEELLQVHVMQRVLAVKQHGRCGKSGGDGHAVLEIPLPEFRGGYTQVVHGPQR